MFCGFEILQRKGILITHFKSAKMKSHSLTKHCYKSKVSKVYRFKMCQNSVINEGQKVLQISLEFKPQNQRVLLGLNELLVLWTLFWTWVISKRTHEIKKCIFFTLSWRSTKQDERKFSVWNKTKMNIVLDRELSKTTKAIETIKAIKNNKQSNSNPKDCIFSFLIKSIIS